MAQGREEKPFPKVLCSPQELSLAAGQRSEEFPAGMIPSAPPELGMEPGKTSQHHRAAWGISGL